MSADELRNFVDANATRTGGNKPGVGQAETTGMDRDSDLEGRLRYLLARRLTRELRGNEAREYYPSEWRPVFDSLAEALLAGWDENLSAADRAHALLDAACITRTNGLELLGTELGPDWKIYDGESEDSLLEARQTNRARGLFSASADELSRARSHRADPEVRFHYRYQAAALAWEAARLMPDNSDDTARVLWLAGSWLKTRDPDTADVFYKALVRRNRHTPLGAAADRIRWFPVSDQFDYADQSVPDPDQPPAETSLDAFVPAQDDPVDPAGHEYPIPGQVYFVHQGDTLAEIVAAANVWGDPVTLEDLLEANPGLDTTHLEIGQCVNIPAGSLNSR